MMSIEQYREFLKGDLWGDWDSLDTDQRKGVPAPPVQNPIPADAALTDLIPPEMFTVGKAPLVDLIANRRSHRSFLSQPLSLEELSFLLWATQGMRGDSGRFRNAPSAGARHPFEPYVIANDVSDLEPGLYRYLPVDHKLLLLRQDPTLPDRAVSACRGQAFCGHCAALFAWTAIPYRTEWRYGIISHKMIAIDAGHVCQNLYLACESIGAGTCAVGAYDHKQVDAILGVDGTDEFAVYLAPVGKVR